MGALSARNETIDNILVGLSTLKTEASLVIGMGGNKREATEGLLGTAKSHLKEFETKVHKVLQAVDVLTREPPTSDCLPNLRLAVDDLKHLRKAPDDGHRFLKCMRQVRGHFLDSQFRRRLEHAADTSDLLRDELPQYVSEGYSAVHDALQRYEDLEDACRNVERTLRSFKDSCPELLQQLYRLKDQCDGELSSASWWGTVKSAGAAIGAAVVSVVLWRTGNTQILANNAIDGSQRVLGFIGQQIESFENDPNHRTASKLRECITRVESIQKSSEAALDALHVLNGNLEISKRLLEDVRCLLQLLCDTINDAWGCCGWICISSWLCCECLFCCRDDPTEELEVTLRAVWESLQLL